ncbi:fatty acyl-CoA reductase wat-like [Anopheles arabiensis]|uniref:fatty acyl-CoA reductase wat-like n=1 Tax=Anopheles arabiensis TaxID=7173 RepID=UPI001AAE0A35|nr:fatty acyl-CoA reductase wat-like [Anopheles arabiensis]
MDIPGSTLTESSKQLNVLEFYRDAVVLVTGGTGFLGKVLVEKLLRSMAVKKVVLLVREKRGTSVPERLRQLISDPIFDKIRESEVHPSKVFAKLDAVETDFTTDEFVKEPYKTDLLNETQIVFHVMATVRFDMSFQTVLDTNVTSAVRLYTFLRQARLLKAIVHVSTFYSNCDRAHIEECVYDDIRYGGWDHIRRILEPLTEAEKAKLMPSIIAPLPNNYTFSKKCAEVMIQKRFSDLPIGIFRPPIVTPGYREPMPGWVDSLQSVTALCIPILKQRLLWYYGDPAACPALAPVDYCIAGLITAACDVSHRQEEKRVLESFDRQGAEPPVYNFYFDKQFISWQQFIGLVGASLPTYSGRLFRNVRMRITRCRILSLITFWWMYLLAYIADFFLTIVKKPKCNVRMATGLKTLADVSEHFRCHTWTARNDNVKRMRQLLSRVDEALLEFDVDRIDLVEYYKHYTAGLFDLLKRKELQRIQKKKLEC